MNRTITFASTLILLSATSSFASGFLRDDAALPRQLERAEQVVVGNIVNAEQGAERTTAVLTIRVTSVLKGSPDVRHLRVSAASGTSLAPELRSAPAVFVLSRSEGVSAPLKLDRDLRSVLWLDGAEGRVALNLAEAILQGDARLQGRALLDALRGPGGTVATDALHLLADYDRAPTAAEAAVLVEALELDRGRFEDLGLAFEVLGRTRDSNVQPALLAALADPVYFNAYGELADALRATGLVRALAQLEALTRHANPRVRARALRTLGELGEASASEALIRATRDPELDVRSRAALALGRVGGEAAPARLRALLAAPEGRLRAAAALGLVSLGRTGIEVLWTSKSEAAQAVLRSPVQARYALERLLR
jgi:hypothetical protein